MLPRTRVHAWEHWPALDRHRIYLKREDEAPYGLTAGKLRKYASLVPYLQSTGKRGVALIGGANSNQLLSAALVLRQYGIEPLPILKKTHHTGTNQQLLGLVVPHAQWRLVDGADWPQVEQIALEVLRDHGYNGADGYVLPEGACVEPALAGALTLVADIARNILEDGIPTPTDIFIDAGTGFSAAALLMGLQALGWPTKVHVTLLADRPAQFMEKLGLWRQWYVRLRGQALPDAREQLQLHVPAFAAAFGSVNAQVIEAIQRYAKLGLLTDPIYGAKHFATVEGVLDHMPSGAVALVIHSGGAQVLPGYSHLLGGA